MGFQMTKGPDMSILRSDRPSTLGTIDRRSFVAELLSHTPDALVVTGLGSSTYDVFASGDSDRYFYLWGAMGGALPIGLGLALAQPQRQVLVVTGDGEQLMGMGALATAAAQKPANLSVVVLDNGHFGETGMQRSHTSLGTRLIEVAKACGVEHTREIFQQSETPALAQEMGTQRGLLFALVHIKQEDLPRQLPTRDGTFLKNRLRSHLGLKPV
jgi:thiamine pyrophosphate-dependent acetolactate synthase large subunit-like protein